MTDRHPTARRLIAEGLRLFADQGVEGTAIVKIEEAAGLAPGSGAFYKHFRSKRELLDAALEDATTNTRAGADLFSLYAELEVRDQAMFIARGTWMVFDTHRDLFLVLLREPALRGESYGSDPDSFPGAGPVFLSEWLATRTAVDDPTAVSVVLLDALTAFWQQLQMRTDPYGINAERFLTVWVDLVTFAAEHGPAPTS